MGLTYAIYWWPPPFEQWWPVYTKSQRTRPGDRRRGVAQTDGGEIEDTGILEHGPEQGGDDQANRLGFG